jgi:hypothetical protein
MPRRKVAAADLGGLAATGQVTEVAAGRYTIMQTADGNGLVRFRPDGEDRDREHAIPAIAWKARSCATPC